VSSQRSRRIRQRTARLPGSSRLLYRIEHYSSLPAVAITGVALVVGAVAVGALLAFPSAWITTFNVASSAITLVIVVAIQHTQAREQAAMQRKLDELLRSFPGADDSLMLLEEASPEDLLGVEEEQRDGQP